MKHITNVVLKSTYWISYLQTKDALNFAKEVVEGARGIFEVFVASALRRGGRPEDQVDGVLQMVWDRMVDMIAAKPDTPRRDIFKYCVVAVTKI